MKPKTITQEAADAFKEMFTELQAKHGHLFPEDFGWVHLVNPQKLTYGYVVGGETFVKGAVKAIVKYGTKD